MAQRHFCVNWFIAGRQPGINCAGHIVPTSGPSDVSMDNQGVPTVGKRVPTAPPAGFSVGTLRAAIPKHCFQRSLLRSMSFLLADLTVVATLAALCIWVESQRLPLLAQAAFYLPYWFFQARIVSSWRN